MAKEGASEILDEDEMLVKDKIFTSRLWTLVSALRLQAGE
jgi:hypothetical protein